MTKTAQRFSIGFVIVTFEEGGQLKRLIEALNRQYDYPPIAIHHDFSQALIDEGEFPPNVRFVKNYLRTGWAKLSVIKAALAALQLLYKDADPDWFFLLSASDYPVMPGQAVARELAAADCDALIDIRPVSAEMHPAASVVGNFNPKLGHSARPAIQALKRRFYLSRQFWFPLLRRTPRWRLGRYTYRPSLDARHPFKNGAGCFFGDHWFCASRKSAQALLNPSAFDLAVQRHFQYRTQPEETYYQTVLANRPELRLCRDNRRFAEWHGGGAHPMVLTEAQIPEMLSSGAFFARKFPKKSPIVDLIDARLDAMAKRKPA